MTLYAKPFDRGETYIGKTVADADYGNSDHLEGLEGVFKEQVNGQIQDAFALRELYEQLGDPKYTDTGAIFDIMAYTVVQKGLELADAA